MTDSKEPILTSKAVITPSFAKSSRPSRLHTDVRDQSKDSEILYLPLLDVYNRLTSKLASSHRQDTAWTKLVQSAYTISRTDSSMPQSTEYKIIVPLPEEPKLRARGFFLATNHPDTSGDGERGYRGGALRTDSNGNLLLLRIKRVAECKRTDYPVIRAAVFDTIDGQFQLSDTCEPKAWNDGGWRTGEGGLNEDEVKVVRKCLLSKRSIDPDLIGQETMPVEPEDVHSMVVESLTSESKEGIVSDPSESLLQVSNQSHSWLVLPFAQSCKAKKPLGIGVELHKGSTRHQYWLSHDAEGKYSLRLVRETNQPRKGPQGLLGRIRSVIIDQARKTYHLSVRTPSQWKADKRFKTCSHDLTESRTLMEGLTLHPQFLTVDQIVGGASNPAMPIADPGSASQADRPTLELAPSQVTSQPSLTTGQPAEEGNEDAHDEVQYTQSSFEPMVIDDEEDEMYGHWARKDGADVAPAWPDHFIDPTLLDFDENWGAV